MKAVIKLLLSLASFKKAKDEVASIRQIIDEQRRQNALTLQAVENVKDELKKQARDLEAMLAEKDRLLESVIESNAQLEHALDEAREQIEIYEEITIPNFKKLLDTYTTHWDCQTSINQMKAAILDSDRSEKANS